MGWLRSPSENSLDGPFANVGKAKKFTAFARAASRSHSGGVSTVAESTADIFGLIFVSALEVRGPGLMIGLEFHQAEMQKFWVKIAGCQDMSHVKQRWLTYVYLSKIMQYCCYMYHDIFRKLGTHKKNVGAASICQGAQGLCTASGEGGMLNSDSVESLKGQERSMQDHASKQSIEIYKTHHDHS